MTTNEVCEHYAEKGINLIVKKLNEEDILIEGDSESLTFLGKLILAHVEENGDGKNISPHGQGSVFFSSESTFGIYIHRLPCSSQSK
jgi:hypothetical protein